MTLMSQRVGQDATRRCDARCYGAKHDKCRCICGGLNHQAGLKQAMSNVRDIFMPLLETRHIALGKKIGAELARQAHPMLELSC